MSTQVKDKAKSLANSFIEGNDSFKLKNKTMETMETKVNLSPLHLGVLIRVLETFLYSDGIITKELFCGECNSRDLHGESADKLWEEWLKIENAFPEMEQLTLIYALKEYLYEYLLLLGMYENYCTSPDDYTRENARYLREREVLDDVDKPMLMEIATSMTEDHFQRKVNQKVFYSKLKSF